MSSWLRKIKNTVWIPKIQINSSTKTNWKKCNN